MEVLEPKWLEPKWLRLLPVSLHVGWPFGCMIGPCDPLGFGCNPHAGPGPTKGAAARKRGPQERRAARPRRSPSSKSRRTCSLLPRTPFESECDPAKALRTGVLRTYSCERNIFMRTPCELPTCERSCEHIPANMVLRTWRPLSAHRELVHLTSMPDGRQYLSMDVLAAKRRRYLARVSGGSPRTQRSHETPRRTQAVLGRDPCRLPALRAVDHAHGRKRPWA